MSDLAPKEVFVGYVANATPKAGRAAIREAVDLRSGVVGVLAVVAAVLRIFLAGQSIAPLLTGLFLMFALVATVLVYVRLRSRNAGLFLSSGQIGTVDAFGHRTGVPVAQLASLHLLSTASPSAVARTTLLLFMRREGGVAMRFYSPQALAPGGLQALASAASLPLLGSPTEEYTLDELQRRFPNALPATQRFFYAASSHPRRTSWIAGGVTVVLFLILSILLLSRSH